MLPLSARDTSRACIRVHCVLGVHVYAGVQDAQLQDPVIILLMQHGQLEGGGRMSTSLWRVGTAKWSFCPARTP